MPSVMLTLNQDQYIGDVTEFAKAHTADMPSADTLKQELVMWRTKFITKQSAPCKTLVEAYKMAEASVNFPNIAYLVMVTLSLAVTSASTERANLTLKFIKYKLRSTISQTSLNAFVLAYKHKDILHKISTQSMCNRFISMKNQRLLIHNPISE